MSQPPAPQQPRLSLKLGLILLAIWVAATIVGALIGLLAFVAKLALGICALVWTVHVVMQLRKRGR